MAGRSLGVLTIDLVAKIGGLTQGMSKAERDLDASTKRMNKMAYNFGRSIGTSIKYAAGSFLAFAGVGLSLGAAATAIKGAIDRADELRDASIRLGVGTEALSKWGYAAQQTGTDMESLVKGLKLLSKSATAALDPKDAKASLFAALGVSRESLTDLTKLVPQVADAFKNMADGPQKAALAMELFGKSGADLIEFLDQGSSGLDEFGDKLERLGGVVTPATAAAADDFNDKLNDLKTATGGVATEIAAKMLPAMTDAVDRLIEMVNKGDLATNMATLFTAAISVGVGALDAYNNAVARVSIAMQLFAESGAAAWEVQKNLMTLGFADGSVMEGFAKGNEARARAQKSLDDLIAGQELSKAGMTREQYNKQFMGQFNLGIPGTSGAFQLAPQGGAFNFADSRVGGSSPKKNNSALDKYFATGGKTPKSTGGKSDAQKDAEKLQQSFDSMKASLTEQIALYGQVSETAKERYSMENGELAKLDPAKKAELRTLLDKIDVLNDEKDVQDKLNEIEKTRDDERKRAIENADQMIESMKFELSILGLTNDEREREIALRQAGKDATDSQKTAILSLTDAMIKSREDTATQIDLMDSLRDSAKGFFTDLAHGVSVLDSLKNALDKFAEKLFDVASSKVIDQLFGKQGDAGGGSWGDAIGGILGSLFGGGKASGGWTAPNTMYRVNERGLEMATVGGRDYMLTGNQPVHVTPNHQLGGQGGVNFYANYQFEAPTTAKTQGQLSARTQRDLALAQRNN